MTWLCSFGGQRRQPRQAALLARTTTLQGFTADNGALTKTLDVKSCERRALCGQGRAPGFERSDGTLFGTMPSCLCTASRIGLRGLGDIIAGGNGKTGHHFLLSETEPTIATTDP
jgi:hypothetical protein